MSALKQPEQFTEFKDYKRGKEIIDGKVYLMASPRGEHADVQYNLTNILNSYFKKSGKRCRARHDTDIAVGGNIYRPDIKVLCRQNGESDVPVIVVEILSKSTHKRDLGVKMKKYAELGIKEYWIVSWELMTVAVYLLSEEKKYEFHDSYALFTEEDKFDEEDKEGTAGEFYTVSFPELKVELSDVFDIFK